MYVRHRGMTRNPRDAIAKLWRLPKMSPLDSRCREWVYFLEADTSPVLVKIGKTQNLKWRVLTISTMSPVALRLIGAVSGPIGTESVFHRMFADQRQHGEWFELTDDLKDYIGHLPKGEPLPGATVEKWAQELGINLNEIRLKALTRRQGTLEKDSLGEWKIGVKARK